MRLVSKKEFPLQYKTEIALGNFDGVHQGHQKLLKEIVFSARKNNTKSLVFSFSEHPENIIKGTVAVKSITDPKEKEALISQTGVDLLYLADFSDYRNLPPEEFLEKTVIRDLNAESVVCGFNFRFGKNGAGDAFFLKKYLTSKNIKVRIISPIVVCDSVVSSTLIRNLVEKGEVEKAMTYLGHPFFIDFPVVEGNKIGRTIGTPTINQVFPENHLIPAKGVYACLSYINSEPYICVSNVGTRPTVTVDNNVTLETHVLNFSGNLYGKRVTVHFYKKLRDEVKFASIDELQSQISRDIDSTVSYFNDNY